ncbi:MAG: STAS domain-containing protein [Candidatus Omnitrophica bacterium]|nr:STAS domain-containing protein [Candidatus Omnitrophota bacterium]
MRIIQTEKNGVFIYAIKGEINIDTASQLKKAFKTVSLEHKPCKILLNLGEVEYIDSLGMASLVELKKKIEEMRGFMYFSNVPAKIISIFGITKLAKIFRIFDTEEEALKELIER